MSVTENRIFLSPPWTGTEEREAAVRAIESGYVAPCGPMVDELEHRLAALSGRRYAIALSSGTAAMDLIMAEYEVDETWTVIAPTLTFIATVGPAWHRGAKIVFVDSDLTGNIDIELLERAFQGLKGKIMVIGVDLYGRCCDYDEIARICKAHKAVFICDSAESVGATYKGRPSGSAGEAAIYSFNGNKIITCSGGGALLTDSRLLAERARKRAQQSRENCLWYEHIEVGYNYRMSNVLAAIGLAQLSKLRTILARRRAISVWYSDRIGIPLLGAEADDTIAPKQKDAGVSAPNHWLNVAVLDSKDDRDQVANRFSASGIETRPVFKPMHMQPVFGKCPMIGGECSEDLFECGLCLPSGTGMTSRELDRIDKVWKALKKS